MKSGRNVRTHITGEARDSARDPAEELDRRRVGPVEILDDDQQRMLRRIGDEHRLERAERGGPCVRGEKAASASPLPVGDREQVGQ